MVAPAISDFGDEDHQEGETGLTVTGFDFFPGVAVQGTLWMFANADRSGASDQLTIGTHTNNSIPSVEIPASPNNSTGTVYLAFHRGGDLAWSNSYTFTLSAGGATAPTVDAGPDRYSMVDIGILIEATVTPGSDPSPTIAWTVTVEPGGATYSFDDDTIEQPTFESDTAGAYTLQIEVTPNDSDPVTDTLDMTLSDVVLARRHHMAAIIHLRRGANVRTHRRRRR